jgi:DNA replication protein DnaC
MPIQVKIQGSPGTEEFQCAEVLQNIFERDLPNAATGNILIVSNAQIYGGKVKDIDLVCIGDLCNCYLHNINFPIGTKQGLDTQSNKTLELGNFCFVIEVKTHPPDLLFTTGLSLKARYANKPVHDVTNQSEEQKYSLKDFLEKHNGYSPYITNYIWLRGVDNLKSTNLVKNGKANYLSCNFTIYDLLELTCSQQNALLMNGLYKLNSSSKSKFNSADIQKIFNIFNKNLECMGELTRRKIEKITTKILSNQQYAQEIDKKLTIISGRAGTGKTIKILRIACDLAKNKGKTCLLLTYNNALVSDMKRMLALAFFSDNLESPTVKIYTIHKFIRDLLIAFEIANSKKLSIDFIEKYDLYLEELDEYLSTNTITNSDIEDLIKSKNEIICFDNIFIDEAQDWNFHERNILYRIFGYPKLVIADGVDQLVRSKYQCNWIEFLEREAYLKTAEKKCIRQKTNLVNFVNNYADKLNIKWQLDSAEEIPGGKVIITTNSQNYDLYNQCYLKCLSDGNAAYDMLFIAPPSMVKSETVLDNYKKAKKVQSFIYIKEFIQNGLKIWDGTNKDLRTEYPVDIEQRRLVQYESCRGLEGWVVVCLELDEFINYKLLTYDDTNFDEQQSIFLSSPNERKKDFAYLWSLIPLTRPIDTLIITLKNPDSELGAILKNLCAEYSDYISWVD